MATAIITIVASVLSLVAAKYIGSLITSILQKYQDYKNAQIMKQAQQQAQQLQQELQIQIDKQKNLEPH